MFERKNCSINLQTSTEPLKIEKITLDQFKINYLFDIYNQTHLFVHYKNSKLNYYVPLVSVLNCFNILNINNFENETRNAIKEKNPAKISEMGPLWYVIGILSVFTVIFVWILILTTRYNKQNKEFTESRLIMKRWKEQLRSPFECKTKKRSLRKHSENDRLQKLSFLNLYTKNTNQTKNNFRGLEKTSHLTIKPTSELIIPKLILDSENFQVNYESNQLDTSKINVDKLSCLSVRTI